MITRSYNNERDIEALFKEINGNLDKTSIKPNAGIEMSKTATATTQGKTAQYVQLITTDALTNNQVMYRGWGYKDLSATSSGNIDITLPNGGFDNTNYTVNAVYLGEKATAPSSRSDVTSHKVHTVTNIVGSSTTSTVFRISFYSNGGGNFGFVLFDWMAVGTKA